MEARRVFSFVRNTAVALAFLGLAILPAAFEESAAQGIKTRPPGPEPSVPNVNRGPVIGLIDFYGLRKVSEASVRTTLGFHEGDRLPASKGDVEERLDGIPTVVESHLEAVCCTGGKVTLYVGIEERGAAHFDLHDTPDGDEMLPAEVDSAYRRFLEASDQASRAGLTREDLTKGYARSEDLEVRAIQDMFPSLVKDNLAALRAVLRDSNDEQQRAVAAYMLGYARDPNSVVNDLQYALRDPDPGVRVNAVHSLVAFTVAGVKVEATWFIEMLNSPSWIDRTKALAALQLLTDSHSKEVLDQIRMRALPSLVEMARWKTLKDALPAYMLLGRVAGIPDKQLEDAWSRGDRESIIAQASKPEKK